jgi:hypothetical protein
MLNKLLILLALFTVPNITWGAACSTIINQGSTESCDSITQYGITWSLSQNHTVGQFINGDYWAVDPGTGVNIINITPGYQYTTDPSYNAQPRHINGSMLNTSSKPQGFDGQRNYDGTKNVGIGISSETPLVLASGDSLLSSISNPDAGLSVYESYVEVVAILTVVASPPPEGTFRPSWYGEKVFYNWSTVDLSGLKNIEYAGKPNSTNYIDRTTGPITFFGGWETRFITPMTIEDNYYWSNYTAVPMALMMNLNYPQAEKEQMAVNIIQMGIDFFGFIRAGGGFAPDAGVNLGYKLPVVYAAVLLNATDMLDALAKSGKRRFEDGYTTGTSAPSDMVFFSEDSTFYVDQALVDMTNNPTWIGYCERANKSCTDLPYSQDMLDMPEWASQGFYGFSSSTSSWTAAYRTISNGGGVFPGISIAVRLLEGGVAAWNNPSLLDYADRYMAITNGDPDPFGYAVHGEVSGSRPGGLIGYMYDTYRMDYPYPPYEIAEPTCSDLTQNGDETGIDCGGSCPPCETPVQGLRKGAFRVPGASNPVNFVETVE